MAASLAPTIADAKRQATVDQVLRATRQLLMARGLDVTMEEIADVAGVGRRTLFRHFELRERLIVDAFDDGVQRYGERLPAFEGDWRTWLRGLCDEAHRMQAGYGAGYWELTTRTDLPKEIAAVERRRRTRRRQAMTRIAHQPWHEAGGRGEPPATVVAGIGAHLSARFTAAVTNDVGQPWTVAADLAYAAIADLLEAARP